MTSASVHFVTHPKISVGTFLCVTEPVGKVGSHFDPFITIMAAPMVPIEGTPIPLTSPHDDKATPNVLTANWNLDCP